MLRAVALAAVVAGMTASAGPAATGVRVASGQYDHVSWALLAYSGTSGAYHITVLVGKRFDASECGTLDLNGPRGITYLGHTGRPSPNYIVGPVISSATHVIITYANGRRITVPTIPPPAGLASSLRFYVHFSSCQTQRLARLAGVDAHGQTVAAMRLPARFGPRVTC